MAGRWCGLFSKMCLRKGQYLQSSPFAAFERVKTRCFVKNDFTLKLSGNAQRM